MVIQTFQGTLLEKKQLTEDVYHLVFSCPESFAFKAGQFIMIKLEQDGMTKMKSYSILNPPSLKGKIELCVKIVNGGFASQSFLKMQEGDAFAFKGPFGNFFFKEDSSAEQIYFLGAGTGVAPLHSMITQHVSQYPDKAFTLIFGVRSFRNLFFHEKFLSLEQTYSNFKYIPCLSREAWSGARGHVQDHLPPDVRNGFFYICGLKEMVLDAEQKLLHLGVPKEHIEFERYN